jgi:lambda repressor-like predicted transcriptional regulator
VKIVYGEFDRRDDLEGYQMLVAHVIRTAIQDVCAAAVWHRSDATAWAMRQLRADEGCIYWAESIDIAWPPDERIIADIIAAIAAGEQVWPSQLWLEK